MTFGGRKRKTGGNCSRAYKLCVKPDLFSQSVSTTRNPNHDPSSLWTAQLGRQFVCSMWGQLKIEPVLACFLP
uniref:Uncharacterized protein n=1 Tax=Anguilla anguilla TaxID=7936 RepID=A0A0E9XF56_ANGAN